MGKKVVIGVYSLNFCDQVEFEGSTAKAPDVLQVGRGFTAQMGIVAGSEYDAEKNVWSKLKEHEQEEGPGSQFGAADNLDKQAQGFIVPGG